MRFYLYNAGGDDLLEPGHQQVCRCARNAKPSSGRRRGGVLVDRVEAEAGDLARGSR
jgi:hypothetical protein